MSNMFQIRDGKIMAYIEDAAPAVPITPKQVEENDYTWARTFLASFHGGVLLPGDDNKVDPYKVGQALHKIILDFEMRSGSGMHHYGMRDPVPAMMNDWLTVITALTILQREASVPKPPERSREDRINDMIFSYVKNT